jgi:pimeloyl-ACP methyl ester carboxylesterase
MGGVLGRALRTTGKAALDRPGASFALLDVATAGAILGARRIKRSDSRRPPTQGLASNEEVVRLPDGRRVAVASHGDPRGRPPFLFHGIPGSRLGLHYVEGPAKERGVRVVCPDRPGVGRSDPHPERTIPGYADDVSALADALGFGRFAVLGYSGGAPYALACGAKLPERVSAVGTMAGAGPHDRPGAREGCSKSDLMLLDLSLRRPFLARLAMFGWAKVARFSPSVALKGLAENLSEPDRRFLEGAQRSPGCGRRPRPRHLRDRRRRQADERHLRAFAALSVDPVWAGRSRPGARPIVGVYGSAELRPERSSNGFDRTFSGDPGGPSFAYSPARKPSVLGRPGCSWTPRGCSSPWRTGSGPAPRPAWR